MANSGQVKLVMKYASDVDFTSNYNFSNFATWTSVPTKHFETEVTCAVGGTAVIAASRYTTIQALGIENLSTLYYATVTYTAVSAATACTVLIPISGQILLTDVVASTAVTITASNAAGIICKVFALCT